MIAPAFEQLLREAAPAGADVEVELWSSAPPGLVPPMLRAIELGLEAFEEVLGIRPLLVRTGGAIPLVSELAARGVPTILSGFALNESNIHSPNERIPAAYLRQGIETAAASTADSPTLPSAPFASPLAEELARRARALPPLRPHRHAGGGGSHDATRAPPSSSISRGCSPTSFARSASTTSS